MNTVLQFSHLMRSFTLLLTFAVCLSVCAAAATPSHASIPKNFFFTENKGQWDDRVLYKCEAKNGLTWFLERDGITLLTMKEDRSQPPIVDEFERDLPEMMRKHPARYPMKGHALKFKFVQSSNVKQSLTTASALAQSVEATGELSWHNNYFLGDDSTKWAPDCRNFTSVIYREVWSGIDIEWYESDGQLEFDFVVHPGFDPNQIKMSCEGLEGELALVEPAQPRNRHGRGVSHTPSGTPFSLNENDQTGERGSPLRNNQTNPRLNVGTGTPACTNSDQNERQAGVPVATKSSTGGMLRLLTSIGELRTALPSVYQISANGSRCELSAQFHLTSPNTFGISLPEHYDPNHILRIDPLVFSTFFGSGNLYYVADLIVDRAGNYLISGTCGSANSVPTTLGAYDPIFNGGTSDGFVTKLNTTGTQLLFSTFIGGGYADEIDKIALDTTGNIWGTGVTQWGGFPATHPSIGSIGNVDNTVFCLNSTGSQLYFGITIGGSADEQAAGIVPDNAGGAYIVGRTRSNNFPVTPLAFDRTYRSAGGYYVGFCYHIMHGQLQYSTYLGGSQDVYIEDVVQAGSGSIIVCGSTGSPDFPLTIGAYDTILNGGEGFITQLNSAGSALIFSTFIGGSSSDFAYLICLDEFGNIIVGGKTYSTDFPTQPTSYDRLLLDGRHSGSLWDGFVAKLNPTGTTLLHSTYLGGDLPENTIVTTPSTMYLTPSNQIVVSGTTNASNHPTTVGAYCSINRGGSDGFVTILDSTLSTVIYSSYIGGSVNDAIYQSTFVDTSKVAIFGITRSADYPVTPGAYDTTYSGGVSDNFFLTCLDITPDTSSAVEPGTVIAPIHFQLLPSFPNPFNSTTTIRYSLPNPGNIELKIFDIFGREVRTLERGWKPGGQHQYRLDGKELASGTYFVRMQAGEFVKTQKMVVLK